MVSDSVTSGFFFTTHGLEVRAEILDGVADIDLHRDDIDSNFQLLEGQEIKVDFAHGTARIKLGRLLEGIEFAFAKKVLNE